MSLALEVGSISEARMLSASERAWMMQDVAHSTDPIPGTVMFQTIGGRVSAFVTGTEATNHVELEATIEDLALAKRRLQAQWRRIADPRMRVHLDQLRPGTEALLQELYLLLLAPVEHLLPPDLPLTIIPVGSMSGIPFHALHDGMSYREAPRLPRSFRSAAGPGFFWLNAGSWCSGQARSSDRKRSGTDC